MGINYSFSASYRVEVPPLQAVTRVHSEVILVAWKDLQHHMCMFSQVRHPSSSSALTDTCRVAYTAG
jgi:hypothetical protein